jgi:tetratricopeptide (TPR) repeat protein
MADYNAALQRGGAEAESLPWHGLQVRLLMAEGREEEALAAIDAFAQAETGRMESENGDKDRADKASARLYLGVGSLYTSIGQHGRAESWYRKLLSVAPGTYALLVQALARQGKMQEAAEVCLEAAGGKSSANAATILAQLLTTAGKETVVLEEVQPLIRAALETEGDNVELLMSVAVMYVSRGDSKEAIGLLRRVIELAPKQTLALNNLATLLAEQPDGHAEALEMIERAMAIAGRQPALLDTQGTIYLQAGESAKAVAGLEEAVAGGASDPRYYFHLAAAYHASGKTESAVTALEKARSHGLATAILTAGDQQLLARLNHEFPPEKMEN